MTSRRATATPHERFRRALLLIIAMIPVIAAVAAPPFDTGTHARAQTHATARPHARAQRHARAQTHARAQGAPPHVLFDEDFENNMGTTPVNLQDYVGAHGERYDADQAWLPGGPMANCNGVIINYNMTTDPGNCNTAPNNYDATGMQSLRALADALGEFEGTGTGNNALAAFSDNGAPYPVDPGCNTPNLAPRLAPDQYPPGQIKPTSAAQSFYEFTSPGLPPGPPQVAPLPGAGACDVGRVQFRTLNPVNLPAGSSSIAVGVNVATINCPAVPFISGTSWLRFAPLLRFRLLSTTTSETVDVGGEINPCTDATARNQDITVPLPPPPRPAGTSPWQITARVGTYRLTAPVPAGWTSFRLEMLNYQANGWGNDSAIDNIQVLDTTPELTKSFSPPNPMAGQTTTLTFTIDNATDLEPKPGWLFTETLPSGMRVANWPTPMTTACAGATITATSPISIQVARGQPDVPGSGFASNETSCAVSIEVTASIAGTYDNLPTNITGNQNVHAPTDTVSVTFEAGTLCFTLAPATATLGSVTPGGTAQGYLGTVTVTDARGLAGAAEWTVTVTSTDFTTGGPPAAGTIPASNATYTAGRVDTTGTITVTDHTVPPPPFTLSNSPQDVLTATQGSGVNTASWDPWISVSVPAGAVIGTYTATITHSVF